MLSLFTGYTKWERENVYRLNVLFTLFVIGVACVMLYAGHLLATQEGYGADPDMSPRQAQDSSEQIGLE